MENCQYILPSRGYAESGNISSRRPLTSSIKLPVSRAQISTPPGFVVQSRDLPPGFSSHDRVDLAVNNSSANQLLRTPPFSASQMQLPSTENDGSPMDVELIDPAILEVGKGIPMTALNITGLDIWHSSSPQLAPFEHEAGLKRIIQQPMSNHQNLRSVNFFGNRFFPQNDTYNMPHMLLDQLQGSNPS